MATRPIAVRYPLPYRRTAPNSHLRYKEREAFVSDCFKMLKCIREGEANCPLHVLGPTPHDTTGSGRLCAALSTSPSQPDGTVLLASSHHEEGQHPSAFPWWTSRGALLSLVSPKNGATGFAIGIGATRTAANAGAGDAVLPSTTENDPRTAGASDGQGVSSTAFSMILGCLTKLIRFALTNVLPHRKRRERSRWNDRRQHDRIANGQVAHHGACHPLLIELLLI